MAAVAGDGQYAFVETRLSSLCGVHVSRLFAVVALYLHNPSHTKFRQYSVRRRVSWVSEGKHSRPSGERKPDLGGAALSGEPPSPMTLRQCKPKLIVGLVQGSARKQTRIANDFSATLEFQHARFQIRRLRSQLLSKEDTGGMR